MPTPRLLHKVPVEITRINKAGTIYDADAREPVQQAARSAPVVVDGQVNWEGNFGGGQARELDKAGPRTGEKGYVLFRYVDLNAKGITDLTHEDRISKIAGKAYDLYIVRLAPMGHYANGPTLVRAYFTDRDPSKQVA